MNQYEKNYNDCEIIKFSKILIIIEETRIITHAHMTHSNYKSIKYYINKTLRLLNSIHYDDKIRRRTA